MNTPNQFTSVVMAFESWFHNSNLPSKIKDDCKDAWMAAVTWDDYQWKKNKTNDPPDNRTS